MLDVNHRPAALLRQPHGLQVSDGSVDHLGRHSGGFGGGISGASFLQTASSVQQGLRLLSTEGFLFTDGLFSTQGLLSTDES